MVSLSWLAAGVRGLALRPLTAPLVWGEYREELTRLHLSWHRQKPPLFPVSSVSQAHTPAIETASETASEAWVAAVDDLISACRRYVVVTVDHTGCPTYCTAPLHDHDTNPTAETVAGLVRELPDLSGLDTLEASRGVYPLPALPSVVTPAPSADSAETAQMGATQPPTQKMVRPGTTAPTAAPVHFHMRDLVDDDARARIGAIYAATLPAAAAAPAPDDAQPVDELNTVEMEVIPPC